MQKEAKGRPLPQWVLKQNQDLTLKEALAKIKRLERDIRLMEKSAEKALRLLQNVLP